MHGQSKQCIVLHLSAPLFYKFSFFSMVHFSTACLSFSRGSFFTPPHRADMGDGGFSWLVVCTFSDQLFGSPQLLWGAAKLGVVLGFVLVWCGFETRWKKTLGCSTCWWFCIELRKWKVKQSVPFFPVLEMIWFWWWTESGLAALARPRRAKLVWIDVIRIKMHTWCERP